MTRLFLRFYLGVILILGAALMIQTHVYSITDSERNVAVVEEALGGGALLVRDEIIEGGRERFDETMLRIQSRFKYPVRVVERSQRPMSDELVARIDNGEAVYFWGMIQAAIPDTPYLVELGPLPQFVQPSRGVLLLAVGVVFLLTAFAIAILLRPVVKQLRSVESAALAIAGGDLSARITEKSRNTIQLSGAFNTMADRVEDSLRAQKELLQSVSHELRTPLARIRFATELIRTADSDERREERIGAIEQATEQLDDLVGELLSYARFDAEAGTRAREPVDVAELIEEVIDSHRLLAPQKRFKVITGAAPQKFLTHRGGLARAIGNLVGNACKYANDRIEITAQAEQGRLVITVDDDGDGIDAEQRERVFEPFHRAADDSQPGHGIGLALVRRICRRLQGDAQVDVSPMGGARLRIELPMDAESS